MEDRDARGQRRGNPDGRALARVGPDIPARPAPSSPTPRRVRRAIGATPSPCATFQSASVRPPSTSGSTTCVSGSPSRQLNSTTHGVPSRSTIRPAYSTPVKGVPRRRISSSAGKSTSARARASSAGVATATGLYAPMPPVLGPGVALEQALVILGDREELDVAAVRDREDRDFLALEKRLDDDGAPRRRRRRARRASRAPRRRPPPRVSRRPRPCRRRGPRPSRPAARHGGRRSRAPGGARGTCGWRRWGCRRRASLPSRTPWTPRAGPPPRSGRTPRVPRLGAGPRARAPAAPRGRPR